MRQPLLLVGLAAFAIGLFSFAQAETGTPVARDDGRHRTAYAIDPSTGKLLFVEDLDVLPSLSLPLIPTDNPLGGLHPIGTYCYHADMKGSYGNVWGWQDDYRGFLESNRWYSIEQHLKLNTPGKKDGILRAWVDGRLAFEKTDIRFRHVDKLKIEQIWMNVYHGGTKPSPYDQHLFIDNVVIAKKYIGAMKKE